ncbi:MAG: hypothetical protein HRU15_01070 [Planctomycetes bacterium]|nr:hypothetical protein [Planctomycetota bacterium]
MYSKIDDSYDHAIDELIERIAEDNDDGDRDLFEEFMPSISLFTSVKTKGPNNKEHFAGCEIEGSYFMPCSIFKHDRKLGKLVISLEWPEMLMHCEASKLDGFVIFNTKGAGIPYIISDFTRIRKMHGWKEQWP